MYGRRRCLAHLHGQTTCTPVMDDIYGGVLAISFNTHVTKRDALIRLMEKAGFETVQTANLEHWVEQAISRDVILARKP